MNLTLPKLNGFETKILNNTSRKFLAKAGTDMIRLAINNLTTLILMA